MIQEDSLGYPASCLTTALPKPHVKPVQRLCMCISHTAGWRVKSAQAQSLVFPIGLLPSLARSPVSPANGRNIECFCEPSVFFFFFPTHAFGLLMSPPGVDRRLPGQSGLGCVRRCWDATGISGLQSQGCRSLLC